MQLPVAPSCYDRGDRGGRPFALVVLVEHMTCVRALPVGFRCVCSARDTLDAVVHALLQTRAFAVTAIVSLRVQGRELVPRVTAIAIGVVVRNANLASEATRQLCGNPGHAPWTAAAMGLVYGCMYQYQLPHTR